MSTALELVVVFVALYPIITAGIWVAGGLLFRVLDAGNTREPPEGGWPGVTLLIPAYNEEQVIARCIASALEADYPVLEVLVLNDGSTDGTAEAARVAAGRDPRVEILDDSTNRGKAERLNIGFRRAQHELVATADADTHLQPYALKLLVSRLLRSERIVAVAAAPHVTNRDKLLRVLQVLEAAAIIGLIRRTQALTGRVSVVAGVLGLFRKDAVLGVGGYRSEMATEDIDLTWRLLLGGGHTAYEPGALVGMEVPSTLRSLWAQRKRWARGQGEVLHDHFRGAIARRNAGMWPLVFEAVASLLWIGLVALAFALAVVAVLLGAVPDLVGIGLAWGIAVAVVAVAQLAAALAIDSRHDRGAALGLALGPLYPMAYWLIAACAAIRSEIPALIRGPRDERVVWDIPRDTSAAD